MYNEMAALALPNCSFVATSQDEWSDLLFIVAVIIHYNFFPGTSLSVPSSGSTVLAFSNHLEILQVQYP